jgi:hypothetical protein
VHSFSAKIVVYINIGVRFEIFMVVKVHAAVFRVMTPSRVEAALPS